MGVCMPSIEISKSPTADTRTCEVSEVGIYQLRESSKHHIEDVRKGINFFKGLMDEAASKHDWDKLEDLEGFYKDFKNDFKTDAWYQNHLKVNRHHLMSEEGVPEDVNLIDVMEMVVDCVMAGLSRSGDVYDLEVSSDVLQKSLKNTVDLLKSVVKVVDENQDYLVEESEEVVDENEDYLAEGI